MSQIDASDCGMFVESDLRPWARGQSRTSDGVREHLAEKLMDWNSTVSDVVHDLMVPVLTTYEAKLVGGSEGLAGNWR